MNHGFCMLSCCSAVCDCVCLHAWFHFAYRMCSWRVSLDTSIYFEIESVVFQRHVITVVVLSALFYYETECVITRRQVITVVVLSALVYYETECVITQRQVLTVVVLFGCSGAGGLDLCPAGAAREAGHRSQKGNGAEVRVVVGCFSYSPISCSRSYQG